MKNWFSKTFFQILLVISNVSKYSTRTSTVEWGNRPDQDSNLKNTTNFTSLSHLLDLFVLVPLRRGALHGVPFRGAGRGRAQRRGDARPVGVPGQATGRGESTILYFLLSFLAFLTKIVISHRHTLHSQ